LNDFSALSVGWPNCKNKVGIAPSYTRMSGRILPRMTRARTHTWAIGRHQPLIQPLLEAVLCALVMIVSNVAAMFGMRFNRGGRDWHTTDTQDALPQTKPDIHFGEKSGTASLHLAALTRSESRPAVDAQRRTQTLTHVTNRASPTRLETDPWVRVPREGGDPVLRAAQTHSHGSALTRTDQTPPARDSAEGVVRLKTA
jgi:hypothetical protein